MSRYTGPKGRHVRRFGVNIYGNTKFDALLDRRPNAPGMHGASRLGKASEYKKQLMEKQKLRFMYGLTEKQLQNLYAKANAKKEPTGLALLKMLEARLDNVIFRAGFAQTRAQARQMVNHGLFTMNGRRVTIASIQVREGDKIEVREKSKKSALFNEIKESKGDDAARWLKTEPKNLSFEVAALPQEEDLDKLIQMNLIIEFYSK